MRNKRKFIHRVLIRVMVELKECARAIHWVKSR